MHSTWPPFQHGQLASSACARIILPSLSPPDVLDFTDGMTCQACHNPPAMQEVASQQVDDSPLAIPDFWWALCQAAGSPSDNKGPTENGCGMIAEDGIVAISSSPQQPSAMIGPEIPPEENLTSDDSDIIFGGHTMVRSLSRPALRMLWHQRLGRLNVRRLSTMHRYVNGMPVFTIPNVLEERMSDMPR